MGRRNPIHVVGEPIRKGVTWLCDDVIRFGAHADALGSDGYVILSYLLSCASVPGASNPWETSAVQMSEQFGWGKDRVRVSAALDAAVKNNRLIIREYLRDGALVPKRRAYVVCAGGRQFTDEERLEYTRPILLSAKSEREGSGGHA